MRTVACVHGLTVNSQGNPLEFSVSIVVLELETVQAALFLWMVVAPCLNLKPHPDLCTLKKKKKKKTNEQHGEPNATFQHTSSKISRYMESTPFGRYLNTHTDNSCQSYS